MKQFLKSFLIPFLGFLLMLTPVVSMASAGSASTAVLLTALSVVGYMFCKTVMIVRGVHTSPNIHGADIEVEVWVKYIIERFWKDNQFLRHAFNDDQYVIGGKIVHIPQPGATPVVRKNRSSFPAAAVRRTDTDILYALDEYTTDPTHIQDAEKVELSYDKIESVLGDHIGAISETVADDIIIKWLTGVTGNNIVKTSGADTAVTVPGTTGLVKAGTHDDLRRANLAMNLGNVPKTERYALLDDNVADQIFQSLSENQYRGFTQYANAETGSLGRLYNFDVFTRSSVALATGADAIKALGAEVVEGDKAVSLLWQKNAVARAMGEVKIFDNIDDPQYYGDIYSALLRMGGRRRRADNKGVIALIQGAAA